MSRNQNRNLALAREMLSPPGDTIQETIEALQMNQSELAERMGRPTKTVNEIIKGKEAITPNTALQLERVLGVKAEFWLERERQYRQKLAEIEHEEKLRKWEPWLLHFPINDMIKLGWIPRLQVNSLRVGAVLSYFAVASPDEWRSVYIGGQLQDSYYRISLAHVTEQGALSAWLRKGELQAKTLSLNIFNRKQFVENLSEIRRLAYEHPNDFKEQLQKSCTEVGVAVVFTPCLPKTNVSGVARWINDGNNPLIQLSGRYKSNDQLWFTFFHEVGHILKHGKKDFFIEGISGIEIDQEKENEANQFAANILIPIRPYKSFIDQSIFSEKAIKEFAEQIEMHPAIVAGRLCHDKLINYHDVHPFRIKVEILPGC